MRMLRQLIGLCVVATWLNFAASKVLEKSSARDSSFAAQQPLVGTGFDYDYFVAESRRAANRRATTTQRPFIRYWNNFVRNIRIPIPHISWNITNPLVNLFNGDGTNVIDSPVGDYHERNKKRKRKNTKKQTKKRKTINTASGVHVGAYNVGYDHDGYENPHSTVYENPYTVGFNPLTTLYFYDETTGQYYKMPNLPPQHLNTFVPAEQQAMKEVNGEKEAVEEPIDLQDVPIVPQIEPPTMDIAVESNESDDEPMELAVQEHSLPSSQEIQESAEVEVIPSDEDNIEESEEEQSPFSQRAFDNKLRRPHNVKNSEQLRSTIGGYVSDDNYNRIGERMNQIKRSKTIGSRFNSQSKQKFNYYLLQTV